MPRSGSLLSAALLRPVNLLNPGVGLLLALTVAPWWTFPLSLIPYAVMVFVSMRDPAFVRRVAGQMEGLEAGAPVRMSNHEEVP